MILCSEACVPMCDFCKHMKPYSDEELDESENFGQCLKLNIEVEFLHDYCDEFHCIRHELKSKEEMV